MRHLEPAWMHRFRTDNPEMFVGWSLFALAVLAAIIDCMGWI